MHENVRGIQKVGLVDKKTRREFHVRCLTTVEDKAATDIAAPR